MSAEEEPLWDSLDLWIGIAFVAAFVLISSYGP